MWNLKYDDTNGLVYKTERDSQTEIKFIVIKRERQGTDELRIQDQKIKTTTYKTDKQQGTTIKHKEQQSDHFAITTMKKNLKNISLYLTKPPCCTPELTQHCKATIFQ